MNKSMYSIWFTGISGSGKSAIADELAFALKDAGINVQRIDEDVLLNDILKKEFAEAGDEEHLVRLASYIASLLLSSSQIPVLSLRITRESLRRFIKESVPDSLIVYTKCKRSECEKRDPHRLYEMVRENRINGIPGVDAAFEEPENPDIVLNTYLDDIKECTKAIIGFLDFNGYLKIGNKHTFETGQSYTSDQEAVIKKRLEDLGYL